MRALSSVKSDDGFISGQKLAEECGVSRTAVWKAVRSLIAQGMNIEAVTNRGYHLAGYGEDLNGDAVAALLLPEFPATVIVYKTLDSTNTEAKRRYLQYGSIKVHKTVIIAEQQTAGKGRLGRAFYSPAGSGIYLSILYSPSGGVIKPARMTAAAAVAVCRTLDTLYGIETGIKWVNDIFAGGKKICGILTEGVSNFETGLIETAIVGIGVNISDGENGFPEDIAGVAGSVLGNRTGNVTRNMLAAGIIKEVLRIYDAQDRGNIAEMETVMQEYRNKSCIIGTMVDIYPVAGSSAAAYKARVLDIDNEARLVVCDDRGERQVLQSGEISLRSGNFSS